MSERAGNHGRVAMGRMEMTPWTGRMIEAIVGRGSGGAAADYYSTTDEATYRVRTSWNFAKSS